MLKDLLGFYAECCTRNRAIEPKAIPAAFPADFAREGTNGTERSRRRDTARPRAALPPERDYPRTAVTTTSCCGPFSGSILRSDHVESVWREQGREEFPRQALKASLGCGNPTALATLNPGETVLDLGSGGGIDVLLSARRVGPTAKPTASI